MSEEASSSPQPANCRRQRSLCLPLSRSLSRQGSLVVVNTATSSTMQGILYKRRDVFRKRWRPRWFVLDPETCVLTYFLLIHSNGSSSNTTDSSRSVLTEANDDEDNEHADEEEEEDLVPQEQQEAANHEENEPEEEDDDDDNDDENNDATTATSMEFSTSHTNDQFFHYGEVARGSLDLRKGHYRIEKRDHLNRRNLFVWSVQPTSSGVGYYLATTTAEERDQWMQRLRDCCNRARNGNNGVHDVSSSDAATPADNNASEPMASTPPPPPATAPTHTWQTISKEHLYEDVPNDLQAKIESVVHNYLGFCCGGNDGVAWQPINVRRASPTSPAVQAFLGKAHLEGNQEISLIKCATVLNHSPSQMLGILMDPMHRQAYEQNLRLAERWKRYNGHTTLDYYAYKPVWPTSPRDFVVAVQWRLLEGSLTTTTTTTTRPDGEKAICICAVSYDAGDHRRFRNHVRGALHVNLTLLRPVDGMPNQCEFVRVLSYSLGGSVPASLSSSVMQKQAGLPAILASYMAQPSLCLPVVADLTREALLPIVREVRQLRLNPVAAEIDNDDDEDDDDEDDDDEDTKQMDLVETSLVLLLPLVLWRAMGTLWLDPTMRGALFLLAVLASVRFVVLQRLGPSTATPLHIGPVTCRFSVNLRRVLRSLADQQNQETDVKVSVVHLVVKAAATALEEMETMNRKVVSFPLLGIHNRSFSRKHVDISILNATTTDPSARFVTVRGASSLTGSEIAASAARAEQSLLLLSESLSMMESLSNWIQQTLGLTSVKEREGNDCGSCLVVASPESDSTSTAQMDLAIVPTSGAFNVVVVVGGVRLQRPTPPPTPTRVSRRSRPTLQPTLDVSISSNSAACGIGETRKFAERLHQLLDQYSEEEF